MKEPAKSSSPLSDAEASTVHRAPGQATPVSDELATTLHPSQKTPSQGGKFTLLFSQDGRWPVAGGGWQGHQGPGVGSRHGPAPRAAGSHVQGQDGTIRVWPDDLPQEPEALRAWIHAQANR